MKAGMPKLRDRVSEVPQRHSSPRVQVQLKKSSSSETDPLHQRPTVDRSSKVADRRSPRGSLSAEATHHKKLGTRVADLESQLGQAQDELKTLKDQLASAEAAKKEVQEELQKKSIPNPLVPDTQEERHHQPAPTDIQETDSTENSLSTDVFEVPSETLLADPITYVPECAVSDEFDIVTKLAGNCNEPVLLEPEKQSWNYLNNEVSTLTSKLEEKDREAELLRAEQDRLNKHLCETTAELLSSQTKEMETAQCLSQMKEMFEETKADAARLKQELEAMNSMKTAVEAEMKSMMVQTEQWRKAADAAAAVLAGNFDMNGRCSSMDKPSNNGVGGGAFDVAGIYTSRYEGSPMMPNDMEYTATRKKGSGIPMFGGLWKKKGQK